MAARKKKVAKKKPARKRASGVARKKTAKKSTKKKSARAARPAVKKGQQGRTSSDATEALRDAARSFASKLLR